MRHKNIKSCNNNLRTGFTLIEIVIAIIINLIVISGVGILLVGGNRSWQKCYNSANHQVKQEALVATLEFSNVGRKSNRIAYTIYKKDGDGYSPALQETENPEEIVSGDAVEFRYWENGLDSTDSQDLMNTTKTATAYAFFYIDDKKLKVDYGPYPPGAVSEQSGNRNTTDITTKILSENVSVSDSDIGAFSHTMVNGVGQGSVRLNINLKDTDDNESVQIMTATYMRNIWPR
jgi:type II secretory pathway pseudopilin PulG